MRQLNLQVRPVQLAQPALVLAEGVLRCTSLSTRHICPLAAPCPEHLLDTCPGSISPTREFSPPLCSITVKADGHPYGQKGSWHQLRSQGRNPFRSKVPTVSINISVSQASALMHALGPAGVLVLALFLLFYLGVVLPAVWSRHAYRRTAARLTMTTLLDHAGNLVRALRSPRRRR